jgi:hypothetical protein
MGNFKEMVGVSDVGLLGLGKGWVLEINIGGNAFSWRVLE